MMADTSVILPVGVLVIGLQEHMLRFSPNNDMADRKETPCPGVI